PASSSWPDEGTTMVVVLRTVHPLKAPASSGFETSAAERTAASDASSGRFRAGDLVQVRSKEEILRTLDANGSLAELPFMPEMLEYCGKTLRIGKRAHKTCDPALGIGGRKMSGTVHLENVRCNGAAHDGCEAGCLIFWKEAWLKPLDGRTETL